MSDERKLYDDWLHQSSDLIISAWDVWQARAALSAPTVVEHSEQWWLHRIDMEKTQAWQQGYAQGLHRASKPAAPTVVEPVAHMYTSDLERFQPSETFATAYSVAVGCPDERSVPLFLASTPPRAPQPLTEDQIRRGWATVSVHPHVDVRFIEGVRFAERAHGIAADWGPK